MQKYKTKDKRFLILHKINYSNASMGQCALYNILRYITEIPSYKKLKKYLLNKILNFYVLKFHDYKGTFLGRGEGKFMRNGSQL